MKTSALTIAVACCVLSFTACRTEIKPAMISDNAPAKRVRMSNECDVRDYATGTEIPNGSKNIGWVEVTRDENASDDDTFLKLRRKVCSMGGDALSSISWERQTGEDRPSMLRGNAWSTP